MPKDSKMSHVSSSLASCEVRPVDVDVSDAPTVEDGLAKHCDEIRLREGCHCGQLQPSAGPASRYDRAGTCSRTPSIPEERVTETLARRRTHERRGRNGGPGGQDFFSQEGERAALEDGSDT